MKQFVLKLSFALALGVVTTLWFTGCKAEVKTTDVAAGEEIHGDHDGHDHDHDHEGHEHAEGEGAVAEGVAAAGEVVAAVTDYPLTTCVVSEEPLDSMGGPIELQHDGQLVRLCCKSCIKTFNKNPDKFLAVIAEARAKAKAE